MIYIILTHSFPEFLKLLIDRLNDDENHFVIHVDKRVDINLFIDAVSEFKNCYFLTNRSESAWGSFALVESVLYAFKFIENELQIKQRIILLSGADFPIKNSIYIKQFLNSHKDTIFIEHEKIPRKLWRKNYGGIYRFPYFDKVNSKIDLYAGSQWFSIPFKVLNIITSFLELNPFFIEYFSKVIVPDESFFQTVLLNCNHPYVKDNVRNQNLHLIKWEKPYLHPKVLTINNYNTIKKSKFLFARKFDLDESSQILKLLGAKI